MSTRNRLTNLPRLLALSLALALPAVSAPVQSARAETASADPSYVFGLVTLTPMVHVPLAGAASEAQLIQQLQAQGFSDFKVTPLSPNRFDPRPELMHPDLTVTSAADERAQNTPVHAGWNGTAVKNAKTVEVYVDRAPR
ncbi:MAG: hypothetical protein ACLQJR_05900 [Stellaceae bacterium]